MSAGTLSSKPRTADVEIAGRRFEVGAPGFAAAIAQAYRDQTRPRCLCRPDGLEMYIARLGAGYVVKRMPETGRQHAPDCPSFEPAADSSGLGPLLGNAIIEDPTTGAVTLKLAFPLSVRAGRVVPERTESTSGTVLSTGIRLSLRSLLHYLWDQAELTHWHPAFGGKRSWNTVRRHLLNAVERMLVCDHTLSTRFYAPETFSVEQRDAINTRRRSAWTRSMEQLGNHRQLMLIVAEVKEIAPARHGYKAVIKHMPDLAFALDEVLYQGLSRRFSQELALWNASEDIRMMMIATFGLSSVGVPYLAALYLMPVTRQSLPVETAFEQQLIARLVRDRRAFLKILRYDLRPDARIASVALTDCGAPAPELFAGEEDGFLDSE